MALVETDFIGHGVTTVIVPPYSLFGKVSQSPWTMTTNTSYLPSLADCLAIAA